MNYSFNEAGATKPRKTERATAGNRPDKISFNEAGATKPRKTPLNHQFKRLLKWLQ